MKAPAFLLALLILGLIISTSSVQGAGPFVSGHVERADGTAFPGVTVTIHDTARNIDSTVVTDGNGNYSSSSLISGSYNVSATVENYRANTTYVELGGPAQNVDFTMNEILGTVTGTVTNGNTTMADVRVSLTNTAIGTFSALSTAPLGQFEIENVTPGVYIAYAEKEGYNTSYYPDPVTVQRDVPMDLNFTLQEQSNPLARLSGKVTYNQQPLTGVEMVLSSPEVGELRETTDGQGDYVFNNVPAGHYTLSSTKSGYVGTSEGVDVVALNSNVENLSLKKDTLPGNSGFLMDYDLAHSLMIVGLGLAVFTTVTALFLRHRVRDKPDLLDRESERPKNE